MPDDHSKLVPLLPIPNRTVKRLRADDSADPCVKVGHRQAVIVPGPFFADGKEGVCLLLAEVPARKRTCPRPLKKISCLVQDAPKSVS